MKNNNFDSQSGLFTKIVTAICIAFLIQFHLNPSILAESCENKRRDTQPHEFCACEGESGPCSSQLQFATYWVCDSVFQTGYMDCNSKKGFQGWEYACENETKVLKALACFGYVMSGAVAAGACCGGTVGLGCLACLVTYFRGQIAVCNYCTVYKCVVDANERTEIEGDVFKDFGPELACPVGA